MKRKLATAGIAIAVALGILCAPMHETPTVWTVAPCAVWATTSHPHLPPHTVLDECARPDGSIDYAADAR